MTPSSKHIMWSWLSGKHVWRDLKTLDVWASFPNGNIHNNLHRFPHWAFQTLRSLPSADKTLKKSNSDTWKHGIVDGATDFNELFLQVVSTVWWGDHDATSGGAFQNSQWGAFGFQAGQRWGSGVDFYLKMVPDMEIWFMTYLTVDFLFWWELHHFGGEMLCENNVRRGSFKPFLLKYVLMWCGFLIRVENRCVRSTSWNCWREKCIHLWPDPRSAEPWGKVSQLILKY